MARHRKATIEDAVSLFELRLKSILQLAPRGMSKESTIRWSKRLTIEGMERRIRETEVWIAEVDNTIAGWIAIRLDYIDGLYVDPAFIGLGVGTDLLNLAEKLMEEAGIQWIRLDASINAEDFYLQRGYEPTGPRLQDVARLFVKRLSADPLRIRPIDLNQDSITELTELLHRAYKRLADMGLRYWATWQTEDITLERIRDGKCFVALRENRLVATITYYYPVRHPNTPWYEKPGVAVFGQFAVEPALQQQGIGVRLISLVEEEAKAEGAIEMALSTAEPAEHLLRYYERRGYRFIETSDFSVPYYRSVIMSKMLR